MANSREDESKCYCEILIGGKCRFCQKNDPKATIAELREQLRIAEDFHEDHCGLGPCGYERITE